ncbi:MAG TPA: hypothetical protein VF167_04550 [Longimicrobiaceae bacterium]
MSRPRIFLLSPAHCGGKRASLLTRPDAAFDLAVRLRSPAGAPLGEIFAFLSGLYFRGKMAYSQRFENPGGSVPGTLVITPCRGLLSPHTPAGPELLREFAEIPIDLRNPRYHLPLLEDAERLRASAPEGAHFVLLGSVASDKYIAPLTRVFGERLVFPPLFAGMGDMQRGSLLLRAAAEGVELEYRPVLGAMLSRARRRGAGVAPPRGDC